MCRLKPHKRCCQSPHFEPVNAVKAPGKVLKEDSASVCITGSSFFLHFPLICRLWCPAGVPPSSRTIITLPRDPCRVVGKEMNSKLGLQGLGYDLVQTKPACSSLHSLHLTDAGNFPKWNFAKATHDRWLWQPKSSPPSDPQSNLFLPTTQNSRCPCSIQSWRNLKMYRKKPLLLHQF